MKPENIMLETNDKLDVKIVDFGFATDFEPKEGISLPLGTLYYKAPELVKREKYNEKVDIWALGCIVVMLLFGKMAFPGDNER